MTTTVIAQGPVDVTVRLRDLIPNGYGYNSDFAHTMADAANEIERLRTALTDTLDFVERHSNRWDGVNGKHPNDVVTVARELLAPNAEVTGNARR